MAALTTAQYRFRKGASIGAVDAEHDTAFLEDCYVDTGDLTILADTRDPRSIVLGRTGSGKTALIQRLAARSEHTVLLRPDQLSLTYLSNNTFLPLLMEIGVDLDLFFRLLWRHVFALELIKASKNIRTEQDKRTFLARLFDRFRDDKRSKNAMQYLLQWGEQFWKNTEYRIQEITTKLQKDVAASVGCSEPSLLAAHITSARNTSEETRASLCKEAQDVVNRIQIRELFEIMELLRSEFLTDPQKPFYVVIDRLDENWVDDRFRYKLIRALIETVKEFATVPNAKIIVALRRDLLDRVIRDTRAVGFQEEKYADLYLELSYNPQQLTEILDKRIRHLIRQSFTSRPVDHSDILPSSIDHRLIDEYLVDQTLRRPRDIIQFFNCCIRACLENQNGNPKMSVNTVKRAEEEHSRERFRSLGDEWHSIFPDLLDAAKMLERRPAHFRISAVPEAELLESFLNLATSRRNGPFVEKAKEVLDDAISACECFHWFLRAYYRVGLVGLKTRAFDSFAWCYGGRATIPRSEIDEKTLVSVHPMFYRILGINARSQGTSFT